VRRSRLVLLWLVLEICCGGLPLAAKTREIIGWVDSGDCLYLLHDMQESRRYDFDAPSCDSGNPDNRVTAQFHKCMRGRGWRLICNFPRDKLPKGNCGQIFCPND
jgi:hypothetical protein